MLASSSRNALISLNVTSTVGRSLSKSGSVCVLQGRRYSTAQDTRRPQFDFGLPDSRSFRAQDAPYSIRPNTSYRAPSAQITAVGRANQELGQIVKQRKGPEAFAFAARMKEQGIVPNGNTYDFLLEACKDASLVPEAWAVFEDMLAVGILPTRSTFHLLLHTMRYEAMHNMWKAWTLMLAHGIKPTEFSYEIFILFVCRHSNLELALQKLSEMGTADLTPSLKSAQAVISLACDMGQPRLAVELAEAFERSSVRRLDGVVWIKCLIASADALYADGVLISWDRAVKKLNLTPDEGCCVNVLHTAGRHGLSAIAPDVIRVLQNMNVIWAERHFAPVVEAFCRAGDVKEAFGILELMRNNGVPPSMESAYPIFEVISGSADTVDEAYGLLDDMHTEGRGVDVAAFNIVIQACVALMDLQRALGTYRAAHDLDVKPNVETYNLLLSACIDVRHRELGDRLLQEMREAGISPDARTYERLIVLCLTQPTYEDAFYYLEEMKTVGLNPSQAIYEAIIRRCFDVGDTRHQLAMDEMLERGYEVNGKLRAFLQGSDKTGPPDLARKVFAPKDTKSESAAGSQ